MHKCPNCGYIFCCCKQPPKIIRIVGDYDPNRPTELSPEELERELEAFLEMKKQDFEEQNPECLITDR